jgi:hypothetical protein
MMDLCAELEEASSYLGTLSGQLAGQVVLSTIASLTPAR